MVEKLAGIHPDVTIQHITQSLAALKLPIIVKDEVCSYLSKNTNPTTAVGFISITALLEKIKKDGVSAIWDAIKERVAKCVFDEFGSLYTSKSDPKFTGLIDAGQYVELEPEDLPSFQKELSDSEGYRKL